MGNVIRLSDHARTVSTGRGTEFGQGAPSGQLSENQVITSSYFRAVKVLDPSSSRSKKRQSPAAKRPIVATLNVLPKRKADKTSKRFKRSSDSMATDDSRKIPTAQELSVGKFRLAYLTNMSDKSDMPTVEQVRETIRRALGKAGHGWVKAAEECNLERNDLRDFMEGRKQSLSDDARSSLNDRYGIPIKDMFISRKKPRQQTG